MKKFIFILFAFATCIQLHAQTNSIITNFDCRTLYSGVYLVSVVKDGQVLVTEKVVINND